MSCPFCSAEDEKPIRFAPSYAHNFPKRHLIKRLRAEGFVVVVEPDDGTKLCYLMEKGVREVLSDPIYALIISIPLDLILGLTSNWLYDHLKRRAKPDETKIVLEFDEKGKRVRYDQSGQPISDKRFVSILSSLDQRRKQFEESQKAVSPNSVYVLPIQMEHTGKIVGWSKGLIVDDEAKGIMVDSTIIGVIVKSCVRQDEVRRRVPELLPLLHP